MVRKQVKHTTESCFRRVPGLCSLMLILAVLSPNLTAQNAPPPTGAAQPEATTPAPTDAQKGAAAVAPGKELVNMDFPEMTDIRDIVKAVALWTGKNVILDRNVTGKVQMISPRKVTKEEAYQAFLSALNILGLTTVETGKVIKIMKVRTAVKGNLKTYMGSSWAPRTDEIITQIIPLKYIEAKKVQSTLRSIVSANAMIAYEPTNTLIISDSGYRVRRVLEVLELLDVQTQQPKVVLVPIKNSDPKSIADKVTQILKASGSSKGGSGGSYNTFKILTDERTNSVVVFGPPRTIKDVIELVKKFDIKVGDPSSQASIHVRPLDYADAKKLASTLSALAKGGANKSAIRRPPVGGGVNKKDELSVANLGDGVQITADDASNSLLITGSRAAYEALNGIIRKLDIRRSQVFIEADILDLSNKDGFRSGMSIFGGMDAGGEDGKRNAAIGTWEAGNLKNLIAANAKVQSGSSQNLSIDDLGNVANTFAEDMGIGIIGGKSFDFGGIKVNPSILIKLIKTDGNNKTLASPHILTSNNEEASISVGEKFFYETHGFSATGVAAPKAEKEDVNLTLSIKPNISHSNYVTMKLEIEANTIASVDPKRGLPNVATRKTKQNVTVKDGQTVVISGLMHNLESESFKKIPLLGDIPILGWFFRNTDVRTEVSNLVIFLTPHVIHGPEDLAAIYKKKMLEREEFLTQAYGDDFLDSQPFFAHVPGAEAGKYRPTTIDAFEEKARLKNQMEVHEMMGYTSGTEKPIEYPEVDSTPTTLAIPIGSGGGDYGGGDDSPPPSDPDGDPGPSDGGEPSPDIQPEGEE